MDIHIKSIVFSLLAISLLSSQKAFSASYSWTNQTHNGLTAIAGNWTPSLPISDPSTTMEFGLLTAFPPFTFTVTNNLAPAFQIGELMILGNAPSASGYNISPLAPANTLVFAGGGPGGIFVQGIASASQTNTLSVPIINNLTVPLNVTSVNGIFSYQGAFTGTGSIIYHGNANTPSVNFPGTILLGGDNSASLGVIRLVDGVILQFASANALGPNAGTILFDTDTTAGGVLQPTVSGITLGQTIANSGATPIIFDLSLIPNGTLTVSDISSVNNPSIEVGWNEPTPLTNSTLIITNGITGSSSLTINSNATVQLTAGPSMNTYSGDTTITSGTLQPTVFNALSQNSTIMFANSPTAILDLTIIGGADGQIVGGISGPGPGGTVILGHSGVGLEVKGSSQTYGGSIVLAPSAGPPGAIFINLTLGETWTLTGTNNTFTGGMSIDRGTLEAGATNTFSPNSFINVEAGAFLNLNNFNNSIQYLANDGATILGSATLTQTLLPVVSVLYGGIISGTGGVTINSPVGNTWTMNGTGSNYSGPTTILSGTVAVGANNALSPNSPVILANNPLANLNASGFTNTIAGLSGGGSSGGNVIVNGGTLTINQVGFSTYGGAISGTGNTGLQGLYLQGGGTLELTGSNNTISNLVNVTTGTTLRAGATNAFPPDVRFILATAAILDLNGYNNTINSINGDFAVTILLGSGTLTLMSTGLPVSNYEGFISGSGGLTMDEPAGALLQLAGVSTYSGPTTITSGTLQAVSSTNALSPNSLFNLANNPAAVLDLNNNSNTIGGLAGGGPAGGNVSLSPFAGTAMLTIQGSNSTTYSGVISGTGDSLTINGPGSLFLDGANTYTGTTTVNAGATLGGTGSVTSNVSVFGTMAPGDRTGTFTINGTYEQESGSTFYAEITPTTNTTLTVSSSATIDPNAAFVVDPQPGIYSQNQTYTVIAAGSLAGTTFSSVTSTSILISASLSYPAPNVVLTLTPQTIGSVARKGNPHKVAVALDTVLASGNPVLDPIFADIFFLSAPEMTYALDQMHPAQLKAQTLVQENNAVKVRDALINHISMPIYEQNGCGALPDDTCCCNTEQNPCTVWVEGFGDWLKQDSTHYASSAQVGYSNATGGFIFGADYHYADVWNVGALTGYTHANTRWTNDHGHGTINSGYLGLYLSGIWRYGYVMASTIGSWSGFQDSRNIIFPGVNNTAKGSTNGPQLISTLDLGLTFNWKGFTVSPFDTFDYITQSEHGFTERHADAYNLRVRKSHALMLRNELGLNFSRCECSHNIRWILDAKISWVREVRLHSGHITASFVGTNVPFTVTGYMPDRSLASPGVSLTAFLCEHNISVNVYYNGLYGEDYTDSTVGADLSFNF